MIYKDIDVSLDYIKDIIPDWWNWYVHFEAILNENFTNMSLEVFYSVDNITIHR